MNATMNETRYAPPPDELGNLLFYTSLDPRELANHFHTDEEQVRAWLSLPAIAEGYQVVHNAAIIAFLASIGPGHKTNCEIARKHRWSKVPAIQCVKDVSKLTQQCIDTMLARANMTLVEQVEGQLPALNIEIVTFAEGIKRLREQYQEPKI